jgi:Prokaryotic cytochrome b561
VRNGINLAKASILTNGTCELTPIENTEDRYGAIAILFHWSMAILVIGLAGLGLYMVTLPDVGFNAKKVTLVLCHKECGVLVFVLVIARLAWRVTHMLPRLVEHLPDGQKIAARFVHRNGRETGFRSPSNSAFYGNVRVANAPSAFHVSLDILATDIVRSPSFIGE